MIRISLLFLLILFSHSYAADTPSSISGPWFTGPLITPSARVVPKGHYNINPYLYATETIGSYNSHWNAQSGRKEWSINQQNPAYIGLGKKWDLYFNPQFFYRVKNQQASAIRFGDILVGAGFQVYLENPETWYPTVKLYVRENFPTGKYQHGNPYKKGTDLVGEGSYVTNIGIVASRIFHFGGVHYLRLRGALSENFHTPVHVEGYNSYGGGHGTKGKVNPGNLLRALTAFEYSLTQRWALACDFEYRHLSKTRFSGKRGKYYPAVGGPSSEQFSLAPAIEYNWSRNLGIIAGSWFSFTGRNSKQFVSGIISLNYYK